MTRKELERETAAVQDALTRVNNQIRGAEAELNVLRAVRSRLGERFEQLAERAKAPAGDE